MANFEKAVRTKLRVGTERGICDVENLWDLPVEELDDIYKRLSSEISEESNSLLETREADADTKLAIEIVKHIVLTKVEEAKKAEKAAETKAMKQRILSIIAGKKEEELSGKSVEELEEMLNNL